MCVPRTKQAEPPGPCSRCGSLPSFHPLPPRSATAPTAVPLLSQNPSDGPTSGNRELRLRVDGCENKLVHAEVNWSLTRSRVVPLRVCQLQRLHEWNFHRNRRRKSIYSPLGNDSFKFSRGLAPGGKSLFRRLVLSQGSGTLAEGSRCLLLRVFPLAGHRNPLQLRVPTSQEPQRPSVHLGGKWLARRGGSIGLGRNAGA